MQKKEKRIKEIFEQAAKAHLESWNKLQTKQDQLKEKYANLKLMSLNLVKKNCNEGIEFFSKYGNVSIENYSINLSISEVPLGYNPDEYIERFNKCATKYKFSKIEEMDELDKEGLSTVNKYNNCVSNCIKSFDKMTDMDLKNCFNKCFKETLDLTENINEKLDKVIEDNYNKFIKFN